MRLDDLINKSIDHEAVQVPVDHRLRVACWATMGFAATTVAVLLLVMAKADLTTRPEFPWQPVAWLGTFGYRPALGMALGTALLVASAVLAVATNGFRHANLKEHYAMAAVAGTSGVCTVPLAAAALVTAVIIAVAIALALALFAVCAMLLIGLINS